MPYGVAEVIASPPLAAPAQGLLVSAQVIDLTDERWYNGITFSPETCGDLEVWAACGATGEVQTVDIPDGTTGGTFTLTFRGDTTAPIAWNATGAAVAAALNALPSIVAIGGVTGGGGPLPGPAVTITFIGGQGSVDLMTGNGTALVAPGAVTVTRTVTGTTGRTKATGLNHPAVESSEPFFVLARDSCSTFGYATADYAARARRALLAKEGKAIERELWTGTLVPGNRNIAQGSATTVGTAGMARGLGLSTLVQAIADSGGSRGMIHARPLLVEQWWGDGLLRIESGKLMTGTGVPVVAGSGYLGTGPAGQAVAGGVEWAYATDTMVVYRGPVVTFPDGDNALAQATDKTTNRVEFRAERGAAVAWSGCVHAAASINVTTE